MPVHDVPTYEEFYGLVNNEIDDYEFEQDNKDEKIKEMIAIMLALLQEFYLEHKYDTEYYISSETFEDEIKEFNEKLKDNLLILFAAYISELEQNLNAEYLLPDGSVDYNIQDDMEQVLNTGIDSVTDTLYTDLKNKADFYKYVALSTGVFSIHSNFRRAIKKLANVVDYNAQYTDKAIRRKYLEFVYGQEALARWRVSGINTCAWCYEMEAMGEMPINWFPADHPNGRCWLEVVNPDEYSEEYKKIRGL